MKKTAFILFMAWVFPLQASEPVSGSDDGLEGLTFINHKETTVQSIMRQQAEAKPPGGELSETIVVKTHERLSDTFEQPIPAQIRESTRDD